MSDMLRITGMVSGMDTDQVIKDLMKTEQIRVDRAEQDKMYLEWKRDAYRDVSSMLKGLMDKYFDVLKPSTNLRSSAMFNVLSANITQGGIASSKVTAVANASATAGTITIEEVTQLATKDVWTSASPVSGKLAGITITDDIATINGHIATDSELSFTLDGNTKTISLSGGYASHAELVTDLNNQLSAAFPSVSITAGLTGGGNGALEFTVAEDGHKLSVGGTNADLLTSIGLTAGASDRLNTSATLAEAFGIVGDQTFTINGMSFTFAETDTVKTMMDQINSSGANVTMTYSEVTDTFKLEADETGAVYNISIDDASGFLTGSLLLADDPAQEGQDAEFTIDGVTTSRSSNTFTINDVKITLNDTFALADGPVEVGLNIDTADAVEAVKGFVDKYNEAISFINKLVSEKRDYNYRPLTDEQKKDMSEDDIKLWEERAKSGLLRSDSTLEKITSSLRVALYESVDSVGLSLSEIGITTSESYLDKGKLVIDESKLADALKNKSSEVIQLFTNESDIKYGDAANRAQRYSENGLSYRIYDILRDNIRLTRDDDGNKGVLIEKAGFEGDTTEFVNEFNKKMNEFDERISRMLDDIYDKENYYYTMFARMESALSRMNSQSQWMMSQFGG